MNQQIKTFADAEARLAAALPGYEQRPPQQALAAFVEQTLANGGQGLAEAGCGTGKSLGAMIPAILSGKRTVIATATIALMEQYANKDVPFLAEHLGVPFTWALLKGRSNYFCEAKAANPSDALDPNLLADLRQELEANPEHSGDREHFVTPMAKEQFSLVASTSTECPGKRECPFGSVCFAEKAKKKAAQSQVVITNTAMLMTDLKVREMTNGVATMLGEMEAVIIDEAHELEEIATAQLEETFRPGAVARLVKEATNWAAVQGATLRSEARVLDANDGAFAALPEPGKDKTRLGLAFFLDHADPFLEVIEALRAFMDDVMDVTIVRDDERAQAKRGMLTSRIATNVKRFEMLLTADEADLVRWVENETQRHGTTQRTLHFAPINVGAFLTEYLWNDDKGESRAAVLVSATMSVGGDFSFIKDRLGLADAGTMNVGTPFDYAHQAMLFVPDAKMPSPKMPGAWMTYSNAATMDLIDSSGGGALLLFTSRTAMNQAVADLSPRLEAKGLTVLVQGVSGTNKEIAKVFAEDTHSVLFALKSFFTGVDIQGEACRLVIINKLPFPVPSEPVFQARADQIKRRGGSDFSELSIPMMTLTLNQGFGRLIRTMKDRGVVAILDSRLTSTGYGRKIVGSLPDCPATTDLTAVRGFYGEAR